MAPDRVLCDHGDLDALEVDGPELVGARATIAGATDHGGLQALARLSREYYNSAMKTLTVRLPDGLYGDIEAESRRRSVPKSAVVRERLESGRSSGQGALAPAIADLVGSIDGLPADLSARKKHHLQATGYGRKRRR